MSQTQELRSIETESTVTTEEKLHIHSNEVKPTIHNTLDDDDELSQKGETKPEKKQLYTCMVCLKEFETLSTCFNCGKVTYCGKECQAKDWPSHKRMCRPKDFGAVDSKKFPLVNFYTDDKETFFVAKQEIRPFQLILVDEPVFFITSNNWDEVGGPAKKLLMGKHEKSFFHIPEIDKKISTEYASIKKISEKAAWVMLEGGLRLKWNGKKDPISESHPNMILTQFELEMLHNDYKLMSPRDFYVLARNLVPSLTKVYSRVSFNTIGEGLFKNAWRLTYSCSPNCMVYLSNGELKVMSVRHIAPGDKLTIPYHPSIILKPLSLRSEFLFAKFGINTCHCVRCIAERAGNVKVQDTPQESWLALTKIMSVFNKVPAEGDNAIKCALPAEVIETFKQLIAYSQEIVEDRLMRLAIEFNYSAYMMELMLEMDASRLSIEEGTFAITTIRDEMCKLIGIPQSDMDEIEKKIYAAVNLDRQFHDYMFFAKVDAINIINIIESEYGRRSEPVISPTHHDQLPIGQNFTNIFSKLFDKPYIYLEFLIAGMDKDDVDRSLAYYTRGGGEETELW